MVPIFLLLHQVSLQIPGLFVQLINILLLHVDALFLMTDFLPQSLEVSSQLCDVMVVEVYLFIKSLGFDVGFLVAGLEMVQIILILFAVVLGIVEEFLFMHYLLLQVRDPVLEIFLLLEEGCIELDIGKGYFCERWDMRSSHFQST